MATKKTVVNEEQQVAEFTAQLTAAVQAAVREAVEPLAQTVSTLEAGVDLLMQRVANLEHALDGARAAYRDLRAQVQGTRVQGRVESTPRLPIGEWNAALNDIRAERGLSATAYVARADVLARAEELRATA